MYTYEIFFCVNNQYSTVSDQRSKCRRSREYPPCAVSRLRSPDQLDQRSQMMQSAAPPSRMGGYAAPTPSAML